MVYFKRAEFWHRTPSKVAASSGTPTMSVAGSSASDSSAGPQANPVKRRRPQDIPPKPFISRSLTQEGWRSRTLTAERRSVTLQDMNERFRVGVDIGGTFTNFVLFYKDRRQPEAREDLPHAAGSAPSSQASNRSVFERGNPRTGWLVIPVEGDPTS